MKVVPLAADSLGVRSMATYVECGATRILVDPGAALAPNRYGLPPADAEWDALKRANDRISGYAMRAGLVEWLDAGGKAGDVWQAHARARSAEIARQTAIADFRLFWDALGTALKDREKILIDSEKMPGHRQLLLFDPKDFAPPMLAVPPNGARHEGP